MKKINILFLSLCLSTGLSACAIAAPAKFSKLPEGSVQIKVGDLTRSYLIHLPAKYDARKSYPLVLAFHGGGGNGKHFMNHTRWNAKSDKANFIVVYPNGTGRFARRYTWNVETCCGYAQKKNSDDVGFVNTLLDDLIEKYSVDTQRVYATGMSNGAKFSYRLACELSDRITAIAPVSGTLETVIRPDTRPVPILHIHGTADQNCPFNGGMGTKSIAKVNFTSVPQTIALWVKHNDCRTTPVIRRLPNPAKDGMTSTRTVYRSLKAPVELITIKGGGHKWPGMPFTGSKRPSELTLDFQAENVIWNFFKRHQLP